MVSDQLNGFILHKRLYRETSYLADIFTLELGKVSAVVRGVRGNKGDKKSLLQSFQPLLISISGRHELRNLNQLESAGAMLNLTGHQLFCGMYMNELLNRLLPKEMAHPELYVVYQHSLNLLKGGCEIEPCLRQFELLLLEDLGYGIELNVEFENGKVVEPDVDYCLILEQGIQRLDAGSTGSNRFSGEALLQVSDNVWTASSLQCAKRITRISLAHLLGRKPLKSRELFQQSWISKNSSKSENAK